MGDPHDLPPPPRLRPTRTIPVWVRGAALAMIGLLAASVILGMYLY